MAAVQVPEAERERRMAICEQCPEYTGQRCRKCGCFMKLKSRLKFGSCPLKKW